MQLSVSESTTCDANTSTSNFPVPAGPIFQIETMVTETQAILGRPLFPTNSLQRSLVHTTSVASRVKATIFILLKQNLHSGETYFWICFTLEPIRQI